MKANKTIVLFLGLVASISVMFQGCEIENNNYAPVASFIVSPYSGTTETVFVFDASASADVEDPTTQLLIRWDFNGDGVWDTDWIIEKFYSIQFIDECDYIAKLEVKDTKGATGQTTETIAVSNGGGGGVTITDPRDGQTYTTELIGSQTWLSENLKYQSRGSWCYDDDPINCETYGRLYDWEGAMAACPDGWHLPSDEEWKQLEMILGMSQSEADKDFEWRGTDQGKKLKSTFGWEDNNNGNNSSGFNGLPGGVRLGSGEFDNIIRIGTWWTSTEAGYSDRAWNRSLIAISFDKDKVFRAGSEGSNKSEGKSVRCMKD